MQAVSSKIHEEARKQISPESRAFVRMSVDVARRVHFLMEQKGMSQTELAEALDKSPSEISKWLSGMHNFTLKSIAKLEAILGAPILVKAVDQMINEKELLEKISFLKNELELLERQVARAS